MPSHMLTIYTTGACSCASSGGAVGARAPMCPCLGIEPRACATILPGGCVLAWRCLAIRFGGASRRGGRQGAGPFYLRIWRPNGKMLFTHLVPEWAKRYLPIWRPSGPKCYLHIWRPNGPNVIYTFGARMGQMIFTHLAPEWAKCYLHVWRPNGPNAIYTFGTRMPVT